MELKWPEFRGVLTLAPDAAQVFAVPLGEVRMPGDELLTALSAEERERAERLKLDKPRRQFVVGRAALRAVLGAHLRTPPQDLAIDCDAHGKPRLAGASDSTGLRFNVAHSADVVIVAVTAGCEVGVDVERVRPVSHSEQIARRYFHTAEIDAILALPTSKRDHAFLQCWAGKEAVLKATGTGLTESLASFRVPVEHHAGTWINIPSATIAERAGRCWLQPLVPSPGYVAALACVGEKRKVACFTLQM